VRCQGIDLSDFSGHGMQFCPVLGPGFAPDSGPSWAPDGRSLAFSGAVYANDGSRTPAARGCPGSCEAIVLAGASGSDPRLVPVPLADAEQPAFLPDGSGLVFTGRAVPGGQPDLYTVATDGSGLTRLTTEGASEPAPCANGSIAYVHAHDLYLRESGGRARRLTHRGGALPDCSPDSRAIAFVRGGALYTIAATGKSLRRLTARHVVDGRPAFSPAGRLIAVTTTTATAGCASFQSGQLVYRIQVTDLQGRLRRSDVIDREECAVANPQGLGSVGWQPLPVATG
jgi:Tol biopolymer transport system component